MFHSRLSIRRYFAFGSMLCLLLFGAQLASPLIHGLSISAHESSEHAHHDSESCFVCRALTSTQVFVHAFVSPLAVVLHAVSTATLLTPAVFSPVLYSAASPRAPPLSA